jgi:hypothetical protein
MRNCVSIAIQGPFRPIETEKSWEIAIIQPFRRSCAASMPGSSGFFGMHGACMRPPFAYAYRTLCMLPAVRCSSVRAACAHASCKRALSMRAHRLLHILPVASPPLCARYLRALAARTDAAHLQKRQQSVKKYLKRNKTFQITSYEKTVKDCNNENQ